MGQGRARLVRGGFAYSEHLARCAVDAQDGTTGPVIPSICHKANSAGLEAKARPQ